MQLLHMSVTYRNFKTTVKSKQAMEANEEDKSIPSAWSRPVSLYESLSE